MPGVLHTMHLLKWFILRHVDCYLLTILSQIEHSLVIKLQFHFTYCLVSFSGAKVLIPVSVGKLKGVIFFHTNVVMYFLNTLSS